MQEINLLFRISNHIILYKRRGSNWFLTSRKLWTHIKMSTGWWNSWKLTVIPGLGGYVKRTEEIR